MLSKLARPESQTICRFNVNIYGDSSYYCKTQRWRRTLTNGKIIELTREIHYNSAEAYIWIDKEQAKLICIGNTINPNLDLDVYDGDIESTNRNIIDQKLTIDNVKVEENGKYISKNLTKKELVEIYRSTHKWDIEYRDKSSDSESESNSEIDVEKMNKHKWKYLGEKNMIIGSFIINAS